jgi:Adaptin N terminal region
MCGYDISWAGFNVIEVMSSNKFTSKRVGYLAASQSFHPGTDLLMLTTNMIRKDLSSTNQYDAGVSHAYLFIYFFFVYNLCQLSITGGTKWIKLLYITRFITRFS